MNEPRLTIDVIAALNVAANKIVAALPDTTVAGITLTLTHDGHPFTLVWTDTGHGGWTIWPR